MGIFLFIVLGGVAGWLASILMRTDAEQGIGLNIIIGAVGALVGGAVFNLFGEVGITGFNVWSLLVAIVGSVILLLGLRLVRRIA